ncbi:pseudaminic acid cytidylyltransferase [Methylomonas montana]|uniref:pseudaminic acid cytidylyltransferase n=1 Tax=Methylomonas montana TaxID=3058963 RepID=UPI00265B5F8D|nr:pseudaminic acid cytidylyltransferase [Methylomonas montana]WKJ89677.1 pseudaminic acid cytidylyltransferase [Methylomonas montana]
MRIAVIPARGGSKRIPRKNIKDFCGKPMIAWSIEAAEASKLFDHIIVSTDDAEIACVAREYGAEIPFMRPPELANDYAGTIPVINHAIRWFAEQGEAPQTVCCIYATAPFIIAADLRIGYETLIAANSDYAFSVTSFPFPIQRAIRFTPNGRLAMFHPEQFNTRSQDLEESFHDAGQFYWGRSEAFLRELPLFSEAAAPVFLPRYRVQDIDTLEDWRRAELMFKVLRESGEISA